MQKIIVKARDGRSRPRTPAGWRRMFDLPVGAGAGARHQHRHAAPPGVGVESAGPQIKVNT
jgi:hypothetical protein